ncbi:MAG: bacterial extracellular solute-binding s, 5 Middle family protein [Betaproteobacteria bacterium]|nr:bacterial extracellular solute-binding s, 5 Middle family protein [Betaproteobacteria bacterium]
MLCIGAAHDTKAELLVTLAAMRKPGTRRVGRWARWAALACVSLIAACGDVWNNPYSLSESSENALYTEFTERPKHLDPAQSYTESEAEFNYQIYEAPFQYHYLKRPYELIPATATAMPKPRYLDDKGRELPASAEGKDIAFSVYDIVIQPGIRYQPHPAFVEANRRLGAPEIAGKYVLGDFTGSGTRELDAADYVYEIKRLANPRVNSPIFGHMSDYIVGLKELGERLQREAKKLDAAKGKGAWLDLRPYELEGAKVIDKTTFRVTIKGKYPQLLYWMAMPFFAPIPWEADEFYSQPGMVDKNFTLDWYPVGTGAYMLTENNPNLRMVLSKNPYFHGEKYPTEGEAGDKAAGLLEDAGKPIPFMDRIVFVREKEAIPYWNKFLQGYYDKSGISSDNFDQAVKFGGGGEATLSPEMEERGISLRTSLATSTLYTAFNWLDPVVGKPGGERARKLRQAISIAVDYEELISIFMNGRGIPSQGPIPPGIFGFREGKESINPLVYDWVDGAPKRKSIAEAKRLMAEAGYPDGHDAKTGAPLVLNLDTPSSGNNKAQLDWYRKQFAKIDVQLEIRATDFNRFQDKVRKGNTQMFSLGWNADYPDPENFLFLFYSPNATVKNDGENKSNYENAEYDRLFAQVGNMENSPKRQEMIDRMVTILRHDVPWMWGVHPKSYALVHDWVKNSKPNEMARNNLKYQRIDGNQRARKRLSWNPPVVWPLVLLLIAVAGLAWLGVRAWRRAESAAAISDAAAAQAPATGGQA